MGSRGDYSVIAPVTAGEIMSRREISTSSRMILRRRETDGAIYIRWPHAKKIERKGIRSKTFLNFASFLLLYEVNLELKILQQKAKSLIIACIEFPRNIWCDETFEQRTIFDGIWTWTGACVISLWWWYLLALFSHLNALSLDIKFYLN